MGKYFNTLLKKIYSSKILQALIVGIIAVVLVLIVVWTIIQIGTSVSQAVSSIPSQAIFSPSLNTASVTNASESDGLLSYPLFGIPIWLHLIIIGSILFLGKGGRRGRCW